MDHRGLYRTEDYEPGGGFRVLFWTLAIFIVSAGILVSANYRYDGFSSWLWAVGTLVVVLAGPPVVQYALLHRFGAEPIRRSWWNSGNLYLAFWWDTSDHRLTRGQFAMASGVPALLLWVVLIPYAVAEPVSAGAIGFVLASYCCVPQRRYTKEIRYIRLSSAFYVSQAPEIVLRYLPLN